MTMHLRTLALAAFLPLAAAACAQSSGVSHPDETIITNSPDVPDPPAPPAPVPVPQRQRSTPSAPLTPRQQAYNPDGAVVGENIAPAPQPFRTPADDVDQGVVVRVPGASNRLPEGTLVTARLLQSISTKTTVEGTEWTAELTEPLERDGQVLIPAGSLLSGKVTEVHGGRRLTGKAAIYLTPIAVSLPDGSVRGFHAQLIDTSLTHTLKVDKEGTVLHRSHRKEEAGVLGLTAGGGAAAGALVGGLPGALVGAGVGAGITGVVWLKEDKQAELPRDTQLTFELTRSLGFDDRDPR